eukprot:m.1566976 g.1566976  ORF g.1566976 m.1566976 type:complete len:86 (+) comp25295_c0_seq15:2245-2502(+)
MHSVYTRDWHIQCNACVLTLQRANCPYFNITSMGLLEAGVSVLGQYRIAQGWHVPFSQTTTGLWDADVVRAQSVVVRPISVYTVP